MSKPQLKEVEAKVIAQWELELDGQSASSQELLPEAAPQKYWERHYYPIMFAMFENTLTDGPGTTTTQSRNTETGVAPGSAAAAVGICSGDCL